MFHLCVGLKARGVSDIPLANRHFPLAIASLEPPSPPFWSAQLKKFQIVISVSPVKCDAVGRGVIICSLRLLKTVQQTQNGYRKSYDLTAKQRR